MALLNYSLPFSPAPGLPYYSGQQLGGALPDHASAVNNLLYGPAGHQQSDTPQSYLNDPYAPPRQYQQRQKNYLPPQSQPQSLPSPSTRSYGREGGYGPQQQNVNNRNYYQNEYANQQTQRPESQRQSDWPTLPENLQRAQPQNALPQRGYPNQPDYSQEINPGQPEQGYTTNQPQLGFTNSQPGQTGTSPGYPSRPAGYTRVQSTPGGLNTKGPGAAKTQVHAVLDYDDDFDDYYDDDDVGGAPQLPGLEGRGVPAVTPIQGPIFLKNGTVPVVPLYSYPLLNNGTFVQIPILWTALSVALGLELRGDIIRGVPCVKRYHQLFCPTAGNNYPIDRIENFIDENKALMKRMYGDFQMSTQYGPPLQQQNKRKRSAEGSSPAPPGVPDMEGPPGSGPDPIREASANGDSYFSKLRHTRQSFRGNNQSSESGRVDACESKVEIVTPYWASNSAGKIRAIVNTQHFEQAIHQEVCSKVQTNRCAGDCGCEQKYKWHRLLSYDPDNDCKGIFMDWFLFPSCCVCRCNPT